VVSKYEQNRGVGFKPSNNKTKNYLINLLKDINEVDDDLTIFIKPIQITEKGDKVNVSGQVFHNERLKDVNLGTFPIDSIDSVGSEAGKGEAERKEREKEEEAERVKKREDFEKWKKEKFADKDKEDITHELKMALLRNPRLVKGKNAFNAIQSILGKMYSTDTKKDKKKKDDKQAWLDMFSANSNVKFEILSPSFTLNSFKFIKGEEYIGKVFSRKNGMVSLKSKNWKMYIVKRYGSSDEYLAKMHINQEKKIDIKVIDYHAL
jgi:hypothetical protein